METPLKNLRIAVGALVVTAMASIANAAAPVCSTGTLFAGAPDYDDPRARARNGQGLLDVPPLGFRAILFTGDRLVTAVGPEIWSADLSAETPLLTRLAGRESGSRDSVPGICKDARFVNIGGIAMLPDGSLAGADQAANTIFLVTDPFGPQCAVSFIAGATQPQTPLANGEPTNIGDADGVGRDVLLAGPEWVAALEDGTIYFIDAGNTKLKKVLPEAPRAVETVAALPDGTYYAMIEKGGMLYAIANNASSEGFLIEVDPVRAQVSDIVRGTSERWLGRGSINLSGLASAGEGLITTQSGQVLYVTPDGEIEAIAGNGTYFELVGDYDPRATHPASDLQLWSSRRILTAGANVFLAYHEGQLYFSASGITPYVLAIDCPATAAPAPAPK